MAGIVRSREETLESELERMLDVLRDSYDADQVLLFGSMATGHVTDWSDIDLVVVKETNKRFLDRIKEVIELLSPQAAVDILVYTPSEFAELSKDRKFVRDEVLGKAKVLYKRGA